MNNEHKNILNELKNFLEVLKNETEVDKPSIEKSYRPLECVVSSKNIKFIKFKTVTKAKEVEKLISKLYYRSRDCFSWICKGWHGSEEYSSCCYLGRDFKKADLKDYLLAYDTNALDNVKKFLARKEGGVVTLYADNFEKTFTFNRKKKKDSDSELNLYYKYIFLIKRRKKYSELKANFYKKESLREQDAEKLFNCEYQAKYEKAKKLILNSVLVPARDKKLLNECDNYLSFISKEYKFDFVKIETLELATGEEFKKFNFDYKYFNLNYYKWYYEH